MTKTTLNDYKINELSKDMESLRGDVNKIMTNHLPHLQLELQTMNSKIKGLSSLIKTMTVINLGSIILAAVLLKFL
jgi:hypothetical protein